MIYCAIPLIIVFSVCYAATRHEDLEKIFVHAAKVSGWLMFFLALVVFILNMISRQG
ncbi:MAG: hypothetical protein LBC74_16255 [Planctomycetaceae bacterium]|jgi:hypothetical protein|nr:hypothetical protein [Planctomycetaceae bacterium]